jgi:N-acetyl-1-D-myo-inositol-2-amino-2-deoxy-alpha-D-glucopyranoside deacetylase
MENKLKSILAVLAHPDDESFGIGGTLAYYAQQGVQVHLVCATRGEVGDVDSEYLEGFASIAERREHELQCAAENLGLASVHFLDYRDSGMPGSPDNNHPKALFAAPQEEVAQKIVHFMRLLQPQVVLTFDPIGGYKHPDHITIHNATVQAFDLAGKPDYQDPLPPYQPQKLYYSVIPKNFLRIGLYVLRILGKDPRHFGRNHDVDLAALVDEGDFPIHAKINYSSVLKQRDEAAACHASQGGGMVHGPLAVIRRLAGSYEYFMQAYPPPEPSKTDKDLFAGVQLPEPA